MMCAVFPMIFEFRVVSIESGISIHGWECYATRKGRGMYQIYAYIQLDLKRFGSRPHFGLRFKNLFCLAKSWSFWVAVNAKVSIGTIHGTMTSRGNSSSTREDTLLKRMI